MRPNEIVLVYSMVETIGLNPRPDTAFISVAPLKEIVRVAISVSGFSEGDFTRMVYVLQVLRVGEPYDDGQTR